MRIPLLTGGLCILSQVEGQTDQMEHLREKLRQSQDESRALQSKYELLDRKLEESEHQNRELFSVISKKEESMNHGQVRSFPPPPVPPQVRSFPPLPLPPQLHSFSPHQVRYVSVYPAPSSTFFPSPLDYVPFHPIRYVPSHPSPLPSLSVPLVAPSSSSCRYPPPMVYAC